MWYASRRDGDAPAARSISRCEMRVPPDVIGVDRDAESRAELVAQIVRVLHRVDARAVRGVHGMQRLDGERHAGGPRVLEQLADAVAHHLARAGQVLARDACRRDPSAGRRRRARGTARRASALRRRRACCRRARRAGPRGRRPGTCRRGNSRDSTRPASRMRAAVSLRPACATWSRHGEMPRMPWRAQPSMIAGNVHCARTVAVLSESRPGSRARSFAAIHREERAHPRRRKSRIAQQARGIGEAGTLARGAATLRALCWPPTIVKCDWWPLSHAMNTTPVL